MKGRKLIILLLLSLAGCGSVIKHDYYYNEIVLQNKTSSPVTDVVIRVEKIHGVFSCSYILQESECSNKFRNRKYLGNPVTLKLKQKNKLIIFDAFVLTVPDGLDPAMPMRGVLEIRDNGMIKPYLEQNKVK